MNSPQARTQTMTRRVDLVNILPALYRQNGNVFIVLCVTVLLYLAGRKKTFGIFIRLYGSAPEIPTVCGKFRNETRPFKI